MSNCQKATLKCVRLLLNNELVKNFSVTDCGFAVNNLK